MILDTSVYLNILDIPGFNQSRPAIFAEFNNRIQADDSFFLPMATIWETGDHIADLASGDLRRIHALRFVDDVTSAIDGLTPYKASHFPEKQQFLNWLADFPEFAKRSKSIKKNREGMSLSDYSIYKEWQIQKDMHAARQVLIWSLDADLMAFDTGPRS